MQTARARTAVHVNGTHCEDKKNRGGDWIFHVSPVHPRQIEGGGLGFSRVACASHVSSTQPEDLGFRRRKGKVQDGSGEAGGVPLTKVDVVHEILHIHCWRVLRHHTRFAPTDTRRTPHAEHRHSMTMVVCYYQSRCRRGSPCCVVRAAFAGQSRSESVSFDNESLSLCCHRRSYKDDTFDDE